MMISILELAPFPFLSKHRTCNQIIDLTVARRQVIHTQQLSINGVPWKRCTKSCHYYSFIFHLMSPDYKVVIAYDFGTTYSGAAYAFTHTSPPEVFDVLKWYVLFIFGGQEHYR